MVLKPRMQAVPSVSRSPWQGKPFTVTDEIVDGVTCLECASRAERSCRVTRSLAQSCGKMWQGSHFVDFILQQLSPKASGFTEFDLACGLLCHIGTLWNAYSGCSIFFVSPVAYQSFHQSLAYLGICLWLFGISLWNLPSSKHFSLTVVALFTEKRRRSRCSWCCARLCMSSSTWIDNCAVDSR